MRRERRLGTAWLWVRAVLALVVLALAVATFVPLIDTNTWWIRALTFPRLQFLYALAVVLFLSLVLPGRLHWLGAASSLLAVAAFAYQCYVFWPFTALASQQVLASGPCPAPNRLRLMEVNVQMTNEHDERLFDEIDQRQPDVLLVEEVDAWWRDRLEQLRGAYPYQRIYGTQNYYGIALLSRFPLIDPEIQFPAQARDPAVFAGVRLPSGDVVRVYGIHPRPPTLGQSSAERDAQIMDTALRIANDEQPSILAGDLNATAWSPVVRKAARIARLLDPRIGRGWYPTWKAGAVVLRWPLDNVLFTRELTLEHYAVLPPVGSDHQPTLTTVCFTPALAKAQTPPEPSPSDISEAHAAVAEGQGEAAPSPEPSQGKQQPEPPA